IEDNGIGREAAQKLATNKNGKGSKLMQERLEILQQKQGEKDSISSIFGVRKTQMPSIHKNLIFEVRRGIYYSGYHIRLLQIFFDGSTVQSKLSGDLPDGKLHVVQPMDFVSGMGGTSSSNLGVK
ncbi:MAG: hypothetical protein R6T78_02255, partial [Dehalococcoidales bacterium]